MSNLKKLCFQEATISQIELDPDRRLFADSALLADLDVLLTSSMLMSGWCCSLPRLTTLRLLSSFAAMKSLDVNRIDIKFKVPMLNRLRADIDTHYLGKDGIFKFFDNFSSVKCLSINFSDYGPLKRGLLAEFKSLRELSLQCSNPNESIDSSVFVGIENLSEISIILHYNQLLESDALNKLERLESIRIWCDQAVSDKLDFVCSGLRSLKRIEFFVYNSTQAVDEKFVHFEVLGKFVYVSRSKSCVY